MRRKSRYTRQRSIGIISRHIWRVPIIIVVCAFVQPALLALAAYEDTSTPQGVDKDDGQPCHHEITNVKDLKDALSTITEWQILGEELGVPRNKLEAIEADKKGVELKLRAVLEAWYDLQPHNPCWETVTDALESMDKVRLASNIKNCTECIEKGSELKLSSCARHGINEDTCGQYTSENTVLLTAVLGVIVIVILTIPVCIYYGKRQAAAPDSPLPTTPDSPLPTTPDSPPPTTPAVPDSPPPTTPAVTDSSPPTTPAVPDSSPPTTPAASADSTQPTTPDSPPPTTPAAPDSPPPTTPAVPADSTQPTTPAVPADSTQPTTPAVPADSTQPTTPAVPDSSQPTTPAVPDANKQSGLLEQRIFRQKFGVLTVGIQEELRVFATELYSKDMISSDVKAKSLNMYVDKGQRASDLMSALESRIRTDSNAFVAIVKILESIPVLRHLAHTLQADYQSIMKDEVNEKNESQETSLSDQLHSAQVHKLPSPSDLETRELEFPLCTGKPVATSSEVKMKPQERLGSVTGVDDNSSDSSHVQEFSGDVESHEDDFKHLHTSHLSPDAKNELIARLRHDRIEICIQFETLLQKAIRAFKDVPLERLATHIQCIPGICYHSTHESSFENDFKRIENAPNIHKVFLILRPYIDFFNFDLLESIINGEQNENLQSELQNYKEAFEIYCKRKVTESPQCFPCTHGDNQVQVTIEVEALIDEATLQNIHLLQYRVGRILNAPLKLVKIDDGSLVLTFLMPSFLRNEVFPLSEEQKQSLVDERVKKVECGDYIEVLEKQQTSTDYTSVYGDSVYSDSGIGSRSSSMESLIFALAIDVTVEAVLRAVEDVENFMELGKWLSVPVSKLHEIEQQYTIEMERKRGVLEYWFMMDPSPSWRRVIWALDMMNRHQAADEIRDNAKPVVDSTLTLDNVIKAVATMSMHWDVLGNKLGVPESKLEEIRLHYHTNNLRKKALWNYWLEYMPNASWDTLAGWLFYMEEVSALQAVSKYTNKEPDPTLTLVDLYDVLEKVDDWEKFSMELDFPESKREIIRKQYSSDPAKGKEEMIEEWLNHHPVPSWRKVSEALYQSGESQLHTILRRVMTTFFRANQRQQFKRAMKEGYVESQIISVLFLGSRGSGKTSARQVIIEDDPTSEHQSTSSQLSVETALVDSTGLIWQKIGPEEMKRLVAVAIKAYTMGIKNVKISHPLLPTSRAAQDPQSPSLVDGSLTDDSPMEDTFAVTLSKEAHMPAQTFQEDSYPAEEASLPEIESVPLESTTGDDIVRLMDQASGYELVVQMNWVRFREQVLDLEFPPVFSRHSSVCIFVVSLSETLDQHPMVDDQGTLAAHTNEEMLKQHIMTVHSQGKPPPKVLIIGSHKDKEKECKETLEAKNKRLLELLLPDFSNVLMYYNRDLKELIFPMNATSPEEEYKVADKIRVEIMQNCTPQPNKIPLRCYILELALREIAVARGRDVLGRGECFAVVRQLHFDEKNFQNALQYLNEQNIIFYYHDTLPHIVFYNPQVLFDKVMELVQLKCRLMEGHSSLTIPGTGAQFKQLKNQGLVTKAMLESFSKHYIPGLFTATELIVLFKALLVLTNYSDSTYFMPFLLGDLNHEEVAKYRVDSSSPASPLLLHFPHGLRNGTFCSLIIFLMSPENCFPHPWKIQFHTPTCLFRNCVRLTVPDYPGSITLINSLTFLEVHLNPSTYLPKLCPIVQEVLLTGLKKADSILRYSDSKPQLSFICPCQKENIHPAILSVDHNTLICSRDSEIHHGLGKTEMIWLGEKYDLTEDVQVLKSQHEQVAMEVESNKQENAAQIGNLQTKQADYSQSLQSLATRTAKEFGDVHKKQEELSWGLHDQTTRSAEQIADLHTMHVDLKNKLEASVSQIAKDQQAQLQDQLVTFSKKQEEQYLKQKDTDSKLASTQAAVKDINVEVEKHGSQIEELQSQPPVMVNMQVLNVTQGVQLVPRGGMAPTDPHSTTMSSPPANFEYSFIEDGSRDKCQFKCYIKYSVDGRKERVDSGGYHATKAAAVEAAEMEVVRKEASKGLHPRGAKPMKKTYKTMLKEYYEKKGMQGVKIRYETKEQPRHGIQTTVYAPEIGSARGDFCRSKKEAENNAALHALQELGEDVQKS